MGNEASKVKGDKKVSMKDRCKQELLRLSWRMILAVEEEAERQQDESTRMMSMTVESEIDKSKAWEGKYGVIEEDKPFDDEDEDEIVEKADQQESAIAAQFGDLLDLKPFHEDFGDNFFEYCPDLQGQFPTNYQLVTKMIKKFIGKVIEGKDLDRLARHYGRTHWKYDLKDSHFAGFAEALTDTINLRLGRYGTIEIMKIWREEAYAIVKLLQEQQKAYKKKRMGAMAAAGRSGGIMIG
uniref:Globin family profile domain-containing protein n=1 Tax=Lotharella oceanica TaxID=641309 RepID=A0A7S2X9Q7_9EUKA|mmetsp:Transcript_21005/g.39417  ORF Transcript_21005/g.39417 Transcript_21005/m.39417 type:complete len:239 (+) Transcript_21005:92-808(+)